MLVATEFIPLKMINDPKHSSVGTTYNRFKDLKNDNRNR